MEKSELYQKIIAACEKAGIDEKKTTKAVTLSFLPEGENKVVDWEAVSGDFPHLRIKTDRGGILTLPNLTNSAHFGSKESALFKQSEKTGKSKGKYFLMGQRVNPQLPADQAAAIELLMGKTITGESVSGLVLPFKGTKEKPDYAGSPEEARNRLTSKDFWKITIQ